MAEATLKNLVSDEGLAILTDAKITLRALNAMTPNQLDKLNLPLGDQIVLQAEFSNLKENVDRKHVALLNMKRRWSEEMDNKGQKKISNKRQKEQLSENSEMINVTFLWVYKKKSEPEFRLVPHDIAGERKIFFKPGVSRDEIIKRAKMAFYDDSDSAMGKSYNAYHDVFVNMRPIPHDETLQNYLDRKGFKEIPTFFLVSAEEVSDLDKFDYHHIPDEPQNKMRKSAVRGVSQRGGSGISRPQRSMPTPSAVESESVVPVGRGTPISVGKTRAATTATLSTRSVADERTPRTMSRGQRIPTSSTVTVASSTSTANSMSSTQPPAADARKILVFNRSNVFEETTKKVKQGVNIFGDDVLVRFKKPEGGLEDGCGEGTKKELLTEFYETVYERLCEGNKQSVILKETEEDIMRGTHKNWERHKSGVPRGPRDAGKNNYRNLWRPNFIPKAV